VEGKQQLRSHLEALLNRVGVGGHLGTDDVAIGRQVSFSHLQLLPEHVTNSAGFFHKKTNIAVFHLQKKNVKFKDIFGINREKLPLISKQLVKSVLRLKCNICVHILRIK
jgi:hypothetical protein